MQKIRIVSLEEDKAKVVAALHVMGALDLRKSSLQLSDDKPASYSTDVSDSLIKVNGALQLLSAQKVRPEKHEPVGRLVADVKKEKALDEIYALGNERKELDDDLRAIGYAEHIAASFDGIMIDFGRLHSDYIVLRAFETDKKGVKQFRILAKKAGDKHLEINVTRTGKKEWLVLFAYDKKRSMDEFLKGVKLNELDLSAKYLDSTPENILRNTRKKRAEDLKRLAQIAGRLDEISRREYSRLSNLREMLEIELSRAEVSSNFKRTEMTFVVEGWVEKRKVEELKRRMANVTDNKAYVEELESGDELAPTQTNRPKFLKPFDYLVDFYSVQRSDEIDPTWIFIISFPIFYGLMVTDVGYGVASFILASYITTRTDPDGLMYNAAKVWQLNAIAAIFFGILSNQFLGFQLPYTTPFHFDWLKNTPQLIAITVLFGVVQVLLGLALGIYNSYHHGHRKLAIARFTSMLIVAFGTVAVAGAFFGAFNAMITEMAGAIAIVSFIPTIALSGSEATEIVNLITHPLSYARLMGFGLGSVIIAFLIDMAFTPHLSNGILLFVLYGVIFILLHFLNMLLSIFEGLVQGVRLNFVEFFSKFYIGNGIKFRPFGYKRNYTKE